MCNERPWWKRPLRVIQTNLQVLDTPRMDEARIAAQIEDLGANVLVVNVGGIYAWYPTALPFHTVNPCLPKDHDLLEDVLIEVRQAIEMANIYSSIISGMMDAFASVISNNLNVIMKVLTSLTILLTLPNIIFGFYGMNVANLPLDHFWWFPLVIAGVAIVVVGIVLKMKDLF